MCCALRRRFRKPRIFEEVLRSSSSRQQQGMSSCGPQIGKPPIGHERRIHKSGWSCTLSRPCIVCKRYSSSVRAGLGEKLAMYAVVLPSVHSMPRATQYGAPAQRKSTQGMMRLPISVGRWPMANWCWAFIHIVQVDANSRKLASYCARYRPPLEILVHDER